MCVLQLTIVDSDPRLGLTLINIFVTMPPKKVPQNPSNNSESEFHPFTGLASGKSRDAELKIIHKQTKLWEQQQLQESKILLEQEIRQLEKSKREKSLDNLKIELKGLRERLVRCLLLNSFYNKFVIIMLIIMLFIEKSSVIWFAYKR